MRKYLTPKLELERLLAEDIMSGSDPTLSEDDITTGTNDGDFDLEFPNP